MYRIGVLTNKASDPADKHLWQAFRLGLREHGWIEGENIVLEYRWTRGRLRSAPRTRGRLGSAQGRPDRGAGLRLGAARERGNLLDPDRLSGSCRSSRDRPRREPRQARRQHYRTGCPDDRPRPQRARTPEHCRPGGQADRGSLEPQIPLLTPRPSRRSRRQRVGLRVQLQAFGARTLAELEGAFAAMARARAQAVLVLGNPLFLGERQRVAELAIKHRLPTMSNLQGDRGGGWPDELRPQILPISTGAAPSMSTRS